jgi:hypothetical protein
MEIYVIKADGSRQLFDKEKVIRTCLRLGASRKIAEDVARNIERNLYDGIPSNQILKMIFKHLKRHKPTIRHLLDLRKGLSLMNPKPEFELFVQILLSENGYEVMPNQIIRGKCVEHEVDAIASKNGITYFVEAKHHSNYHTPTGLDESRIARAVLEDVSEGFHQGLNNLRIDSAMIVTNTRFSGHAKQYGECRNIMQIGWSSPPDHGLQDLIEEKKLHPMTCISGLGSNTKKKLVSAGILLMKQLVEESPDRLSRKIGISRKTIGNIIERARSCTYNIHQGRQA